MDPLFQGDDVLNESLL